MKMHHILSPMLGLLAMLIAAGSATVAMAAEIRGTIATVEDGARVRIDLPRGSVARPGDEVRVETVVPGIGLVEIKSRWRVKLVGEDFVIAEPEGAATGTPQAGYTAVVVSGAPAPTAAAAETGTPPEPRLRLSGEQLAALQKAAEGGDVFAMRVLGAYHQDGADSSGAAAPRNIEEAARWYGMAAEKGDVPAMMSLGFLNQTQRRNPSEAARWFRKAAEKGEPEGMYQLSKSYAQARDIASDAEVIRWLRRAAEKNHDSAVYELAEIYLSGRGVKQNSVAAARWFRKSADKGFTPAMARLGGLYAMGNGVAKNMPESFRWMLKAAEGGYPFAMSAVGSHYQTGVGVAANPVEARRWHQLAAKNGEPESMYALAYIYHFGLGVDRDPAIAADWMIQAIRAGSFDAAEKIMIPRAWSWDFLEELQKRLRDAGVYNGKIDGAMGRMSAETRQAIAELAKTAR